MSKIYVGEYSATKQSLALWQETLATSRTNPSLVTLALQVTCRGTPRMTSSCRLSASLDLFSTFVAFLSTLIVFHGQVASFFLLLSLVLIIPFLVIYIPLCAMQSCRLRSPGSNLSCLSSWVISSVASSRIICHPRIFVACLHVLCIHDSACIASNISDLDSLAPLQQYCYHSIGT